MDQYERIKVIGKGSFGCAVLCRPKKGRSDERVVIKEINVGGLSSDERKEALNEIQILQWLKHPNIVSYRDSFEENKKLCIVMEYASGGDLHNKIQSRNGVPFTEANVLDYFVQICLALKHVHDRKILHRDLKTQNIFVTGNNMIKLGDFGIARVLKNTMECAKTAIGTPYYLSPEICQNKHYNNKSDIWSLGCILYELCTLSHAFDAHDMKGLIIKIVKGIYPPIPRTYSKDMSDLIGSMLQKSPSKRPSVNQILNLPFIRKRISAFLSSAVFDDEFSHTVLHKDAANKKREDARKDHAKDAERDRQKEKALREAKAREKARQERRRAEYEAECRERDDYLAQEKARLRKQIEDRHRAAKIAAEKQYARDREDRARAHADARSAAENNKWLANQHERPYTPSTPAAMYAYELRQVQAERGRNGDRMGEERARAWREANEAAMRNKKQLERELYGPAHDEGRAYGGAAAQPVAADLRQREQEKRHAAEKREAEMRAMARQQWLENKQQAERNRRQIHDELYHAKRDDARENAYDDAPSSRAPASDVAEPPRGQPSKAESEAQYREELRKIYAENKAAAARNRGRVREDMAAVPAENEAIPEPRRVERRAAPSVRVDLSDMDKQLAKAKERRRAKEAELQALDDDEKDKDDYATMVQKLQEVISAEKLGQENDDNDGSEFGDSDDSDNDEANVEDCLNRVQKFKLDGRTLHLPNVTKDDPITHRIESLRMYLEELLDIDTFVAVYQLMAGVKMDDDDKALGKRLLALLGSDKLQYCTLIQQLIFCEESAFA